MSTHTYEYLALYLAVAQTNLQILIKRNCSVVWRDCSERDDDDDGNTEVCCPIRVVSSWNQGVVIRVGEGFYSLAFVTLPE